MKKKMVQLAFNPFIHNLLPQPINPKPEFRVLIPDPSLISKETVQSIRTLITT